MKRLALIAAACTLAPACAVIHEGKEAMRAPTLSPISSPEPLAGPGPATFPMPERAGPEDQSLSNSLWRAGARAFFVDQRARSVGDILTVRIEIDDSADLQNRADRQRSATTSAGVTNFFGLENQIDNILPNADPSNLVGAQGSSEFEGSGAVRRSEKIEMTVAALVVDALPNGNLVIAGKQQVLINAERRDLTVTGVIRPQDIAADNTIRSQQIAEARIAYGGNGQVSAVTRPRWGQRAADAVSPW
jgi:flagellar L-ring protein FlgH